MSLGDESKEAGRTQVASAVADGRAAYVWREPLLDGAGEVMRAGTKVHVLLDGHTPCASQPRWGDPEISVTPPDGFQFCGMCLYRVGHLGVDFFLTNESAVA